MGRKRTGARVSLALVAVMILLLTAAGDGSAPVALAQEPTATTSNTSTPEPQSTDRELVQFVNPSGPSRIVSIQDDGTNSTYHLVAWSNSANPDMEAEFRYRMPGSSTETTIARVPMSGSYVFEHPWQPPSAIAGREVTIIVAKFDGSSEVARDEESVLISGPEDAATVEITTPAHGPGWWGVYTSRYGVTKGTIDVTLSDDADRVRVFYTRWAPGTHPQWDVCGTETAAEARDGIICTIDPSHAATANREIRAVAAVASSSADPDAAFEGSGDAHVFAGGAVQHSADPVLTPTMHRAVAGGCSQLITVSMRSYYGQPIIGATIEIHAQGPDDDVFIEEPDTANSVPEEHQAETRTDCSGSDDIQAEHELEGPDIKHVLSTGVTDDQGRWSFRVYSPTAGQTNLFVRQFDEGTTHFCYYDEADATIGWDQDPKPPEDAISEGDTECPPPSTITTCTNCGHITTSGEPSGPERHATTVSINTTKGRRLLHGRVDSARAGCVRTRLVSIHRKGRGVIGQDWTDEHGSWRVTAKVRRGTYFAQAARKVFTRSNGRRVICAAGRSSSVRLGR